MFQIYDDVKLNIMNQNLQKHFLFAIIQYNMTTSKFS